MARPGFRRHDHWREPLAGVGAAVVLTLAGCDNEPTKPRPAVQAVEVAPAFATIESGMTVQLTATLKDGAGNALPGRVVLWTTGHAAAATVSPGGLVRGNVMGWAPITATSEGRDGRAEITVTPPPAVACLATGGSVISVTGVQTSGFADTSLADNVEVDASTAHFLTTASVPIRLGGGSNVCFHGGTVIGEQPPSTSWSEMHETYGMVVKGAGFFQVENIRMFNYGDGPTMDGGGVDYWTIRGAHLKYMRDDCVENDFLNSGTIEDSFLDGCYDGVSARPYTVTPDGSSNLVVVRSSLMRLQAMDAAYSGPAPNHNAFWKWHETGPRLVLRGNVFRADAGSYGDNSTGMYMAPPPGKLVDCENNVMVWLGPGPFPEPLPTLHNGKPCFRLLTGAEGLAYWNGAVAQWRAAHPATSVDAASPVISMFAPGIVEDTALVGTVALVATAVDDQEVVGVQFQLDGQSIGAEVTEEVSPTKFQLLWDSRERPNGTYTLTATARDAAARTRTSPGVTITVQN